MSLLETFFTISEVRSCPLYAIRDNFTFTGIALIPPRNKPTCVFLARIMTEIVLGNMETEVANPGRSERREFNCPGCTGLVKLEITEKRYQTLHMKMLATAERRQRSENAGSMVGLFSTFPFFQALDAKSLKDIITCLVKRDYQAGAVILKKGTFSKYLHIIIDGAVSLLNEEGQVFATLGKGEVFGEMSLLSGNPASATVRAAGPVKLLQLPREDLDHILLKYPFLQVAFTRLLIKRLYETSDSSRVVLASGMAGQLLEIPAAELFQMVHENSKSGTFTFTLPEGEAVVYFIKGEIVKADYGTLDGKEAFFAILKEKEGFFQFTTGFPESMPENRPIDGFMKLLMEGLRRIDEEHAAAA